MKIAAIVSAILLSASLQANAVERVTYQAVCMNYAQLLDVVGTFEEIPVAHGLSVPIGKKGTALSTIIFVNADTKSFTVAERVRDDKFCIIVLGTNFGPVPAEIQNDFRENNEKRKL